MKGQCFGRPPTQLLSPLPQSEASLCFHLQQNFGSRLRNWGRRDLAPMWVYLSFGTERLNSASPWRALMAHAVWRWSKIPLIQSGSFPAINKPQFMLIFIYQRYDNMETAWLAGDELGLTSNELGSAALTRCICKIQTICIFHQDVCGPQALADPSSALPKRGVAVWRLLDLAQAMDTQIGCIATIGPNSICRLLSSFPSRGKVLPCCLLLASAIQRWTVLVHGGSIFLFWWRTLEQPYWVRSSSNPTPSFPSTEWEQ